MTRTPLRVRLQPASGHPWDCDCPARCERPAEERARAWVSPRCRRPQTPVLMYSKQIGSDDVAAYGMGPPPLLLMTVMPASPDERVAAAAAAAAA